VHFLGKDSLDERMALVSRQQTLRNTIQFKLRTVIDVGPVGFHADPAAGYGNLLGRLEQKLRKLTDATDAAEPGA
jgi:hypothetical protein